MSWNLGYESHERRLWTLPHWPMAMATFKRMTHSGIAARLELELELAGHDPSRSAFARLASEPTSSMIHCGINKGSSMEPG